MLSLPRLAASSAGLETKPSGWTLSADGFVVVKLPDGFEGLTVSIDR